MPGREKFNDDLFCHFDSPEYLFSLGGKNMESTLDNVQYLISLGTEGANLEMKVCVFHTAS